MSTIALGESIPPDTAHAVSVSLPTWNANVGYEEGAHWVTSRMVTGYPRSIQAFAQDITEKHGRPGQQAMLFPTEAAASRCLRFMQARSPSRPDLLDSMHFGLDLSKPDAAPLKSLAPAISAVLFHQDDFPLAKQYWQHSGEGVSSRRAEFSHGLFKDGLLAPKQEARRTSPKPRGPKRYQRPMSIDQQSPARPTPPGNANGGQPIAEDGRDAEETLRFLEERFGRNLDLSLVQRAKSAIRRRIAGAVAVDADSSAAPSPDMGPNTRGVVDLREDDIYLYPTGMNAIFNAHQYLLRARGERKSVSFGFPYVDTLKILEKFGPGCLFYGRASEEELDELETRLQGGEEILGLFCEFPGNPLLTCPNLVRIRQLADKYDFAVVIDETIGTFANVNLLPFADVVVSSLTKIFSGDCNVMGGSLILNPRGRFYGALKSAAAALYDDAYWPEDVIFMERNSRDFASRIDRINSNAEAICEVLRASPLTKSVHYPKYNHSRPNYDAVKLPTGGYGGLLSVTFHHKAHAVAFYDAIETAKGPSLGTNFTLTSPYVLLAHYQELDWAASLGVDADLIRISVGLEETAELRSVFQRALDAATKATLP
ncbi:uncharacterized protein E0L32_002629 [Thyridium curvatum]|uniref:cystathionine gamma-synthase n=1 Tax=Thyridium curvatum TaxID=1093900 RepID=A0A507BMZ6_9PEZI|nr:uncharacterized protein E0L32_002629 [Thyridium curvatum]TPX18120.1 hypothetical protein E0L32_002629 [Thyridium curvatum]